MTEPLSLRAAYLELSQAKAHMAEATRTLKDATGSPNDACVVEAQVSASTACVERALQALDYATEDVVTVDCGRYGLVEQDTRTGAYRFAREGRS